MHDGKLCAGDRVQVRSREEILATLDEHGCLDGMPFMPEMLSSCGKTLSVFKRAHKACDTIGNSGGRKIDHAVHLMDSRCDGSAHGGCEGACLLYWKEAWLEPVAGQRPHAQPPRDEPAPQRASGCSMQQLVDAARRGHDPAKGPRYACQATEHLHASRPLSPYDLRQYIEDYRSGNVSLATMLRGALYRVGVFVVRRGERLGRRIGLGGALAKGLMACYDAMQRVLPNGVPFPRRLGTIPKGQPTPDLPLGQLRPGSWVRVKSYPEILATLDGNNRTRGLYFDAEHVPYCGKEFPVRSLVSRIIDERTGCMLQFKSPSIILDQVCCQGTFSDGRMFCPRAIYPYWRPVWLEPVEHAQGGSGERGERRGGAVARPDPVAADASDEPVAAELRLAPVAGFGEGRDSPRN